jgi:hypothetical protein
MKYLLLPFAAAFLMASCSSSSSSSETSQDTHYTCDELGWSLQVPTGWEITVRDEKTPGETNRQSRIFFQKNAFYSFQAITEPLKPASDEAYAEWLQDGKKEICNVYLADTTVQTDTSATTLETIGGKAFHVYDITTHISDDIIRTYRYYNGVLKGHNLEGSVPDVLQRQARE